MKDQTTAVLVALPKNPRSDEKAYPRVSTRGVDHMLPLEKIELDRKAASGDEYRVPSGCRPFLLFPFADQNRDDAECVIDTVQIDSTREEGIESYIAEQHDLSKSPASVHTSRSSRKVAKKTKRPPSKLLKGVIIEVQNDNMPFVNIDRSGPLPVPQSPGRKKGLHLYRARNIVRSTPAGKMVRFGEKQLMEI